MVTEIYLSTDNENFEKVDLFKDEPIIIKTTKKDLQDISKIFAPYSQSFTFPATPKNKKILGFFGDSKTEDPNNKFYCKFYGNGQIAQTGIFTIERVKYKNNNIEFFGGSFATSILSLQNRIGSATLKDLSTSNYLVSWKPSDALQRLNSFETINGIKYYIPLASRNRVWSYNTVNTDNDNIFYHAGSNPYSDKVINFGELRPAITFTSILDLIILKYNLNIDIPLKAKKELSDMFIWGNGKNFNSGVKLFKLIQDINFRDSARSIVSFNLTDSSVKIDANSIVPANLITSRLKITLSNVVVGDNLAKEKITISIVKKSDFKTVLVFDFEVINGQNDFDMDIPMYLFTANQFEFFIYIESATPIFWERNTTRIDYSYFDPDAPDFLNPFNSFEESRDVVNSDATGLNKIDLLKSLPEIKVIDFLLSFIKQFNISIYDISPSNENLSFLTPIETAESMQESNYTRYADNTDIEKKVNNPYNFYNLKHKTSSYRSNVDFLKEFKVEYGQATYPNIKPTDLKEFKIETNFAIVPPVKISGLENVLTFYGFTGDAPTVNDNGFFRYTPNTEDLTIFYNNGLSNSDANFGIQNSNSTNILTVSSLLSHFKSLPYCQSNNFTLAFSPIVINNVQYNLTLFSKYYLKFIQRLLNLNAFSQVISFTLPSTEIYLNDSDPLKPKGFRMMNEVINGEMRYEILEAEIDQTTGKAKLTLLNY